MRLGYPGPLDALHITINTHQPSHLLLAFHSEVRIRTALPLLWVLLRRLALLLAGLFGFVFDLFPLMDRHPLARFLNTQYMGQLLRLYGLYALTFAYSRHG